jgi:acetolactate synthase-1/2/3 large subunit
VASPDGVTAVARMLTEASRPVVVAGQESDPTALAALAAAYGAGVYTAFRRQDAYPNDDEHYLGHLGLGNPPEVLEALERADVVLVLGERLDEITTQGFRLPAEASSVVHVHRDPAVLGVHQAADLALVADPARLCRELVAVAPQGVPVTEPWWRPGHEAYLAAARASAAPDPAGRLHPGRVVEAVQGLARPGTVVVNDAGNHSQFLHRQWCFTEPGTQAAPVSGAMGYAVPGGIGAALARPDRTVLAFAGDGGFLMTATELETAARLGVGTKFVVLQNGLHGTIAMHQARAGHGLAASHISGVDVPALSRALGVPARGCDAEDELADAAKWLLAQDGPALLCVRTDPDVVSPGTSLSELAGG